MKINRIALVLLLVFALGVTGVTAAEAVDYTVNELGMTLSVPADYNYIFTRDSSDDDPVLADWGITKADLFENESVYLEALTEDQNGEIIVSMMQTDWSEMYYDFNAMKTDYLEELAEYCLLDADDPASAEYSDYSVFDENGQARFLKAVGTISEEGATGSTAQYVTVINGNAYTVTFNFYGSDALTEDMEALSDSVVTGIFFENVTAPKESNHSIVYLVMILILLTVIGLLVAVILRQRNALKNEAKETEANDKD